MSHQRTRLRNHIDTHPGRHFNELTRTLDLAPGQVQYHLKRLRRNGEVVEERLYGRTHYYPPGYEAWNRAAIALLRRETARDVLVTLLERGPTDPSTVADGLEIARSTLEYHLDRLVEQGLVEKRRDSHNHVTLVLVRPAATAELLAEISPSLPERLVDRFTRLFDDLLVE